MRVSFRRHEEKDFVDICTQHDGKDVVSRVATAEDMARWPEEFAAYRGTPPLAAEAVPDEPRAPESAPTTVKLKRKG